MSAFKCMRTADTKDFQDRVKYFVQRAAISVMSESDQTANHADRVVYAQKVLNGQTLIYELAVAVTTNLSIAASIAADQHIPDNDLEYTVNSMFDAFAG